MSESRRMATVAGWMVCLLCARAVAQDVPPSYPDSFREPMPIYRAGLGALTRPITTQSAEAQRYFDQGLQLLYAFTPRDAARSFREAQRRDSSCAMCWLGEAWAWGPYLNGQMSSEDAPRAYAAMRRASALAERSASAVERDLIRTMAVRYAPSHQADQRKRLDTAYARALAALWARYPRDLEVGTLYAESLMLLEPRRGIWEIQRPEIQRIHRVLEEVLTLDITHPGACHLYVHATESTTRPGKAEACAEYLGLSIPGASHINHMPSHTFNRVGRWGESVRANLRAWHSDQRAEIGEGFAIYPSHNLHMLLFAASYDGQGAVAMQAAADYARLSGEFYRALTMVRFGRFEELLALHDRPTQAIQGGLWDFGRGYAHLREGRRDSARLYLERVQSGASQAEGSAAFRGHRADQLLGIVAGVLEAELARADGNLAEAVAAAERAVALEDGLTYDEPEPLPFSPRHWLGALLLEAGHAADAVEVYRDDLERHPRNGWSLFGLEQSLRAAGRTGDAERARDEFEEAWARADVWLRSSRF